ncbi:SDR family NAD(P)-dependent oxidoreductase [Methylobacterium nonmethylotrophicum]|uniref:SDR family oxidoreductase n=1 Tax=Methylobacterium nonmethylotrophicum TaxID=1141884 RepID=A0A4Z0NGD2_9HYPH|nr:SDR family NAD(P)-dependent oxidoreductase [Methylobacterium nonmethylotrophicum]TGD95139.1 SDR family oxidoreductase [Methylobacterium nonmethylotrophicum]
MAYPDRFKGRAALVTGGASGIGLSVAARLKAEGAAVALWDLNAEALAKAKAGTGATDIRALDIADPSAVEAAMRESVAALGGRLDVLVCSAGITGPNTTVRDYPVEAWQRVIDVNLNGLFYCNRAALPAMAAGGYGRIVNVASIAGKEGNPNASAYSASKAGVIGLTKSLGKELAKSEIRVNCVTPAAVRTAIFDQMTQEHIDFMLSKIPIGRFGTIDEVTSLICFLASEEASFSTGAVFDVSGGRATY